MRQAHRRRGNTDGDDQVGDGMEYQRPKIRVNSIDMTVVVAGERPDVPFVPCKLSSRGVVLTPVSASW